MGRQLFPGYARRPARWAMYPHGHCWETRNDPDRLKLGIADVPNTPINSHLQVRATNTSIASAPPAITHHDHSGKAARPTPLSPVFARFFGDGPGRGGSRAAKPPEPNTRKQHKSHINPPRPHGARP